MKAHLNSILTLGAAMAALLLTPTPSQAAGAVPTAAHSYRLSRRLPHRTGRLDPVIRQMVREVSPARLRRTVLKLVSFGTRNTLSSQDDPHRGIGAARDWIYTQFQQAAAAAGGRMTVRKDSFLQPAASRIPHPTVLTDVVATLRGSDPGTPARVCIISGHYDSICSNPTNAVNDAPGADDDGSGVAVVVEMAQLMARHARELRGTVILAAVAGEEQGLYGSTHLAEEAVKQGWRVEGMFTDDIVGASRSGKMHDAHAIRVFSEGVPTAETPREAAIRRSVGGENDSASRQMARFIKAEGERYVPGMRVWLIFRRDRYLRGGDHIPFLERRMPAIRFTEPYEDFHHQHQNVRRENGVQFGDLPAFMDFPFLARVTRVNLAAMAAMAAGPAPPMKVGLVTRRLTNDTELRWQPGDPDIPERFEVVWRDTTAPLWTHTLDAGHATQVVLPDLSKDDYLFGVRAVDAAGRRSPVVFPVPVR